jgi:hypothetical protein
MSLADTERRRQAWLAFASAAISGYQGLEKTYKDADQYVEELVHNSAVIADDMLIEYTKREKADFEMEEEDDEEEEEEEEVDEDRPRRGRRS